MPMADTTEDLQRAIYQAHPHLEQRDRDEERTVRDLGDRIGYGRLMQLAQQCWREWAVARGLPGSEFAIGPCAAFMVACPCPEGGLDASGHCEWCCGSGRVTERVLKAMSPDPVP
jgi:hypothetical protein